MRHLKIAFLAITLFAFHLSVQHVVFAETAPPEKLVPLFDGKSLDNFEKKGGTAEYRIENGEIVGTSKRGTPNTFLCTKKHYSNFILELDFKVHPKMNSGIQIRSNAYDKKTEIKLTDESPTMVRQTAADGTVTSTQVVLEKKLITIPSKRVHGYQVEIDPSARSWSAGIYDESRRGWLNNLANNEPARKAFKQNQWNHYRIVANGNSIKTWINGVPAADLVDDMTPSGFIALQVHNTREEKPMEVRWRNLRIQVLDP